MNAVRRAHDRLWRALAGSDGASRAGLPFDEALAPVPLLALVVLVVNDRVLKAEVPSWLTGKLSDVAGLAVAPLVLTALLDTLAYVAARLGAPLDWTLRRWKLLASIVLVVNDRVLKAEVPSWLTGKLSDVAGLAVAPLVLTALLDTLAYVAARLGAPLDWTLRRWKLLASIGATGAVFAAVKLWEPAADALAAMLARVFGQARIVADPTDLLALPALAVAWWHGRRTLAQVPFGRVAWARRTRAPSPFDDVAAAGADPRRVDELARAVSGWLDGGDAPPVDRALAALRHPDGE